MSCTLINLTYISLTHFCLLWPWLMKIPHTPNSKSHVSLLFLRSIQRIFPSRRSCVTFCNILVLQSEELLHLLSSPQAGEPPFVGCPLLIQSYLPHLAAIFSNHDLRIGHVTVTQTHYHGQWWNVVWIRAIRSSLKILRYQSGHQDICSDWLNKQQPYGYIWIVSKETGLNAVKLGTWQSDFYSKWKTAGQAKMKKVWIWKLTNKQSHSRLS